MTGPDAFVDVEVADGHARATVRAEHAAALCAGHFPGDPIVPGASLAALMAELGSAVVGGAELAEVERCTFRRRVVPVASITVTVRRIDPTHVEAEVLAQGMIAARARIRYRVTG